MNSPLVTGPEYATGSRFQPSNGARIVRPRRTALARSRSMASSAVSGCPSGAMSPIRSSRARNRRRVRVPLAERVGREVVEPLVVLGQAVAAGRHRGRGEVGLEEVVEGGVEDRVGSTGSPLGASSRAPCGSTNRQRSRTGHRSCFGFWAWQITRPWWISRTCAAYISSGWSRPRNRSCAWSAVAFGGSSPIRFDDPLDVPVDRHQRRPEAEREHDRGGLLADAVDRGEPVARLERRQVAEERERVVAALLADVAERRLEARRLLRPEAARAG